MTKQFPFNTPHSYASNALIVAFDQDGKFPVGIQYQMTYEVLIRAKISKTTATEIVHYASTSADHPSKGILYVNKVIALNFLYTPGRLDYNDDKYRT